ncbi:hypothetical protein K435DRAFT_787391 [Dendrothele bispora CBS 962.96]|uniref:Uncharacterized protein n=1 Tax=Dendrothele bispora (strain CBS 962.96) TaxID=1314807 RepID=A0A4S8KKP4_DENBC|nr:hypothetical protein K435DRAFT_787391 [Dendrothele bispora CBS 962.96]
MSGTNALPRTIYDSAISKVGDRIVYSDLGRTTISTDAGQPGFLQPTSQPEADFDGSHDHDANTDNHDGFHRRSGDSGGDPEQYDQQTSTGNDQGTENAYGRNTDDQTAAEDVPSNSLENFPASHDDDNHHSTGQPFSQLASEPEARADFDGSHDHGADTNNYDGFHRSSGNSRGDPEQYDQQTSTSDNHVTESTYGWNTDGQIAAEDTPSNPLENVPASHNDDTHHDSGQPFSQPASEPEADDADTNGFHRGSGNPGGDQEQCDQQTSTGNDRGTESTYGWNTDGQTAAEEPPSKLNPLENFPAGHDDDTHHNAGQPFSQPTSQPEADFDGSHDHDADTNYDGFQHSSGNSGEDPEQYDQQTSTGNDQGTESAYGRSTDGQTTAEDPPSNPLENFAASYDDDALHNAGQPLSQPTSQPEADFDGFHDHDADMNNYDGFQHSSGSSGGDPEQYDQQTVNGNDQGTENAHGRNTDGQTTVEDSPSNPTNFFANAANFSFFTNSNINNTRGNTLNNISGNVLQGDQSNWDDDIHYNAGQPFSQPNSQANFNGSYYYDADTNNYNGFRHSSGNSGGGTEWYDQPTSGNDQRTDDAYSWNTDSQATADDPLSNPTNTGHSGGPSRIFGGVNGGCTEQDNRKINRNIQHVGVYNEGKWETFLAGGGVATTAFYAGHKTATVQRPSIPTNNTTVIIYPQYPLDLVHPLVVSYVILPVMLIHLFPAVREHLVAIMR